MQSDAHSCFFENWLCVCLVKKIYLLLLFLFTACTEVLYLSVEQMLPPEYDMAAQVKSVGVLNNFSQSNVIVGNNDMVLLPCDADSVKEYIAMCFADIEAMEKVVVLDSLFYPADSTNAHLLSQQEVNDWCLRLGVDLLYVLDYACMAIVPSPWEQQDATVFLCSHIYTPDTELTKGTAIPCRKIQEVWFEQFDGLEAFVAGLPRMLGGFAVESFAPTWRERERVYFSDMLSYPMREARVYVTESNWEQAAMQWRSLADSKWQGRRFMAAFNMALYYEMTDSMEEAVAQIVKAEELAVKRNRQGDVVGLVGDTALVNEYMDVLFHRQSETDRLSRYFHRME